MKKILLPLALIMLAGCATKSPQQMNGRELARCAWKGNADCKMELQHRLQVKQGTQATSSTSVPAV